MGFYTNSLAARGVKVAVTGHSSGVGKEIYNKFNSIGFSRSNGFDIESPARREQMIKESNSCDIFINNACSENLFSQIDLLYELEKDFKGSTIVNISSNSGDGIKNYVHKYAVAKAALDKASEQLFYTSQKRIINLRPGYFDTDRVKHINDPKMNIDEVIEVLCFAICLEAKVKDITFTY